MKRILFVLSVLLLVSCGHHDQSSRVVEPQGTDIEGGEKDPTLILINAVEAGNVQLIEKALNDGGDPNTLTNEGLTLLMVAVRGAQFAMVDLLVRNGAQVEAEVQPIGDKKPKTARYYLNKFNGTTKTILEALLDAKEIPSAETSVPLMKEVEELHLNNTQWLLKKGADPNFIQWRKRTPLIALLSIVGIDEKSFPKMEGVFNTLVAHKEIDVNLTIRRGRRKNCALKLAKLRIAKNPLYQGVADRLTAMGAKDCPDRKRR